MQNERSLQAAIVTVAYDRIIVHNMSTHSCTCYNVPIRTVSEKDMSCYGKENDVVKIIFSIYC